MPTELKARAERQPREQRAFGNFEFRDASDGGGGGTLVGYASVTEQSYTMQDWLGPYEEVVRAGAFTKTLSENDDVRLLINHEGIPLARTKSGTLRLREILSPKDDPQKRDQTGLWVEADLASDSGLVNDMKSAMRRGDADDMSMAFQVVKQEWSTDFDYRSIQEVKLFDVSLVTFPANPATSASLRSLLANVRISKRDAEEIAQAMRMPTGYALRDEHRAAIGEMMDMLAGRVPIIGRALDAPDVSMMSQALGWLTAIDNIVDEGQEALAAYLQIPNPDADDEGATGDSDSLSLARAQAAALELSPPD